MIPTGFYREEEESTHLTRDSGVLTPIPPVGSHQAEHPAGQWKGLKSWEKDQTLGLLRTVLAVLLLMKVFLWQYSLLFCFLFPEQ